MERGRRSAEQGDCMNRIDPLQYGAYISLAEAHDCGSVYPQSIAEGIQEGDIFTLAAHGHEQVLFWAHCGFAYLAGDAGENFLEELYGLMADGKKQGARRFLFMTRDPHIEGYFAQKEDVAVEKRFLYTYSGDMEVSEPRLPDGFAVREIDGRILERISGQIVPSLFWKKADDFLERGKGYCIVRGDDIASWAFSAAVSTKEIDIGIETNAKYKRQGLAGIAAQKMIQYVIRQGKRPVWACHYRNTASAKTAEKLGFVRAAECSAITPEIKKRRYTGN